MVEITASPKNHNNRLDALERDHRAMAELVDKIEHLIRFQERIDKPMDVDRTWQVFTEEIRHHLEVAFSGLLLVDPDTHEFRLFRVSPEDRFSLCQQEVESQIECNTFAWVINRQQPSVIPSLVLNRKQTLILIPLVAGSRTLGVILLLSPMKDHTVTREKLKILTILGKQCALVIDNARLYSHLQKEHENLLLMQNQVIQSEKFASLGRMTSRIFHELLNPLNILSSHIQLLQMDPDSWKNASEYLDVAKAQSDRMAGIIKSLLQFSTTEKRKLRSVDVFSLVGDFLRDYTARDAKHPVIVGFKSSTPHHHVVGDPDRLTRTLGELTSNALEAMPKGGMLAVEIFDSESAHGLSASRRYVGIKFSDTGSGISEAHIASVFDPFFTTKTVGDGMGISLALGYAAIRSMGGTITVESAPGQGSAFTIHLPVRETFSKVHPDGTDIINHEPAPT